MSNHTRYMRLAKKISSEGVSYSHSKKVGACIVFDDKSISCAANNVMKSHPVVSNLDPNRFLHAEIAAALRKRWVFKNSIPGGAVYVYREFQSGLPALAKPCEMCEKFLKHIGIRKFVYTISEFPFYKVEKV